jgi:hypothetical protein
MRRDFRADTRGVDDEGLQEAVRLPGYPEGTTTPAARISASPEAEDTPHAVGLPVVDSSNRASARYHLALWGGAGVLVAAGVLLTVRLFVARRKQRAARP